ncbi:flagellar M-ring protein FliF [bacterium SCSIO 12696]|nr:flagellar M-ring protein FliF [bacterium SCSIO 12696]
MALVDTEKAAQQFGGFSRLPLLRQLGLMVGLAASVALGVWVVNWAQSPDYVPLFGSLSSQDAADVVQVLEQSGVAYKLSGSTVAIPSGEVHRVRLQLASQGVPRGEAGGGFELLDKEQPFGTSSFMEKARYNRALEGELSKSITTLASVQTARVHLAVPKRTVFTRRGNEASASVLVNLFPGRNLNDSQVAGIVYLVASSIPGMKADSVSVVDQQGRLLTNSKGNSQLAASTEQFRFVRDVESSYSQRIVELLTPMLGPEKVSAQVSIDMDFTDREETSETYAPTPGNGAVRSEQTLEEDRVGNAINGGVPGAETNTPPEEGEELLAAETPAGQQPSSSTRRATRNFEVDRTISHERKSPGEITRLSVAVVVDYLDQAAEDGTVQRVPLPEEELGRIEALVREAVGFNEARGDSVNILNSAFRQEEALEPLPEPGLVEDLLQNPMYARWGKQLLGVLGVVILIFGVLKPVLRSLAQGETPEAAQGQLAAAANGELQDGQLAEDQVTLTGNTGVLQLPGGAAISYEQQLDMAKSIAREDPKRVAQVVKSWVDEVPT